MVVDGFCERHDEATGHADYCVDGSPNEQPISDEVAREVLRLAERNHDAEIGINWDTLIDWLDYVRGGNNEN